jgi:cathepsin A (carboxypeptidase C)
MYSRTESVSWPLIYDGNWDLICNAAGNIRRTDNFDWPGQMEYSSKKMTYWHAIKDGETVPVGKMNSVTKKTKEGNDVTFAFVTIGRAGHMLPLNQPEISLQMTQYWIFGNQFSQANVGRHESSHPISDEL